MQLKPRSFQQSWWAKHAFGSKRMMLDKFMRGKKGLMDEITEVIS